MGESQRTADIETINMLQKRLQAVEDERNEYARLLYSKAANKPYIYWTPDELKLLQKARALVAEKGQNYE